MFVAGNMLGLAFFVSSALVVVAGLLMGLSDAVTMISVGVYLCLIDLIWRWRKRKYQRWWWSDETGGTLFRIPAWLLGVCVILINLVNTTTN